MQEKIDIQEIFGANVFTDAVMKKYLSKSVYQKLKNIMNNNMEMDDECAKEVANAMKTWAVEKGATHYTHWFQPLNGITAEKHNSFLYPASDDGIILKFPVDSLITGEADSSSFPSGGLRSTFEARGYTKWEYTSPAFLKEDSSGVVLCIPTIFHSPNGESLDKKRPLLNSCKVLNEETIRLLKLFNIETKQVIPTVGVEQEYFLIDKEIYNNRKDLKLTGRTLFGKKPEKCQETNTHYLGAIPEKVGMFMKEVDIELWKLGVLSTTKHNEVAPCQFELACIFEHANLASDHNQCVMETLKKVADRNGLVCLLHEKPFDYLNGSGKHNNWSMATEEGINLLAPGEESKEHARFLLIMAAFLAGVNKHRNLLRATVANISNDRRLSGYEAPPSIISAFLGEELTSNINNLIANKGKRKYIVEDFKLSNLNLNSTDRNRTSPLAYLGNRFEFRMLGSSASIAVCNTALNTIIADEIRDIADQLENSKDFYTDVYNIIVRKFEKHKNIIYNGNGYSNEWIEEAGKRGIENLKYAPDSFKAFSTEDSIDLFVRNGVYTKNEILSRCEIKNSKYINMINIEAITAIDIAKTQIIPACIEYLGNVSKTLRSLKRVKMPAKAEEKILQVVTQNLETLTEKIQILEENLEKQSNMKNTEEKIENIKTNIIPTMNEIRKYADNLEGEVDKKLWPFPTYTDILYHDE